MPSILRREPSAWLLGGQLLSLLLYPFLEGSTVGRALFNVVGIALLGLVVLAVRQSPGLTWIAVLLGGAATVLLLIQAVTGRTGLLPWSSAVEAVLYFYAAGALIGYMLADHDVTRDDELFAVGAAFTLVAWGFAHVYVVSQVVAPHSFLAALHPGHEPDLGRAAVPQLHHAVQHRTQRCGAGPRLRAGPGHARGAGRARLPRHAGVAAGRSDHHAPVRRPVDVTQGALADHPAQRHAARFGPWV